MTEVQPVKVGQKLVWSLGDYRELARQFEPTAVALVEACGRAFARNIREPACGYAAISNCSHKDG